MRSRVLITGGAGFVGSYVADELLAHGYEVRALDSLIGQVHETAGVRPSYLSDDVDLIHGDVRDRAAVRRALDGVDAVFHAAALVGVGQSMYQVADYVTVNAGGTAVLMEALVDHPVRRLVVASSMSVYGEGRYRDSADHVHDDVCRTAAQIERGEWEPRGRDGHFLTPAPTPEEKRPNLASVYALTKYDQERLCLLLGAAYKIPTVALRFFNIYGPRQALSNPYTGVLANFAARYLNGKPPVIFEDGSQQRDFVHVRDVARAVRLALEVPDAVGGVFNVASGRPITISEVAARMARVLGRAIPPEVTGTCRLGDIRHCIADIGKARRVLGYRPEVEFDHGLVELAGWLESQLPVDRSDVMREELSSRGLAV
jgi:dTDP-L-rhamnose 4-epimerase